MNQTHFESRNNEAALRARIEAGSEDLDDYLALLDLLQPDGRDEEAIRVCERALNLRLTKLQRAMVLTKLGALLDGARGERERARTLAREALDLVAQESESGDVLLLRGVNLVKIADVTWSQDLPEAERIARLALPALERVARESGEPEDTAFACFNAAWVHNALGDHERAIVLLRCLELAPHDHARAETLNMLAEALRLAGRLEEAEEAVQRALRLLDGGSAFLSHLLMTLGLVQKTAGRPADARESFARALQTLMQHRFLRHDRELLGTIYAQMGEIDYDAREYAQGVDRFRQALANYRKDGRDRHRVLIWLGDCHLAVGAIEDARACYQEGLSSPVAMDPERQHARDGLAIARQ